MRYAADRRRHTLTAILEEVATLAVSETRRRVFYHCPEFVLESNQKDQNR